MAECELCKQGDPAINVRCWLCENLFHLHRCQLDGITEGVVVLGDCPKCGTINCWIKTHGGVAASRPVIYDGRSRENMRGER